MKKAQLIAAKGKFLQPTLINSSQPLPFHHTKEEIIIHVVIRIPPHPFLSLASPSPFITPPPQLKLSQTP